MARDQAKRLTTVETALGMGSLQEQIEALPDMHLEMLAVLEQMHEVYHFMDYPVLVRRFLTALRRRRAFTPPGWTPAMAEEFQTRLRQLRGGSPECPRASDVSAISRSPELPESRLDLLTLHAQSTPNIY